MGITIKGTEKEISKFLLEIKALILGNEKDYDEFCSKFSQSIQGQTQELIE